MHNSIVNHFQELQVIPSLGILNNKKPQTILIKIANANCPIPILSFE